MPDSVRAISVEAGATLGWERYTGSKGKVISLVVMVPWRPIRAYDLDILASQQSV
ncbi:MAG: hypothetical protein U5J95_02885 [Balneolaceae bacterium]|nr:hypothetical protein [Balneolaceae bacterium]